MPSAINIVWRSTAGGQVRAIRIDKSTVQGWEGYPRAVDSTRVVSPSVASDMMDMMESVMTEEYSRSLKLTDTGLPVKRVLPKFPAAAVP